MVNKGLIPDIDDDIALTWTINGWEVFGTCIPMKVASISYALDLRSIPEEMFDAALYEGIQTIRGDMWISKRGVASGTTVPTTLRCTQHPAGRRKGWPSD